MKVRNGRVRSESNRGEKGGGKESEGDRET